VLAGAEWSAPVDLSAGGQFTYTPQVAVDGEGDAVFTWARGSHARIQARARSATGTLSAVKTLTPSGQDAGVPQVAVDPGGDAVLTWALHDGTSSRVQAQARSAAGTWSTVQDLSDPGDAGSPQVAIDADGDAIFIWQRSDGTDVRIQSRTRSAAGTWSAVKTLSENGRSANAPQVAVDPSGDTVVTWERVDREGFVRIQARARSAAGAWSAVQTLSDPGDDAYSPQVAVDADGDAVFTWVRSDGINQDHWIQARARSAAGTLSPVQDLSDPDHNGLPSQVAVDGDGDAVFTWSRSDGENFRVQARARSAGGTLSAVQTLSERGRGAQQSQVAVDADGDAVITWARFGSRQGWIQARTRSASGALSKVKYLSDPGQNADFPQVAVDPGGDAVVTWRKGFGLIQASAGP
jgi:hypothetical protein